MAVLEIKPTGSINALQSTTNFRKALKGSIQVNIMPRQIGEIQIIFSEGSTNESIEQLYLYLDHNEQDVIIFNTDQSSETRYNPHSALWGFGVDIFGAIDSNK